MAIQPRSLTISPKYIRLTLNRHWRVQQMFHMLDKSKQCACPDSALDWRQCFVGSGSPEPRL